MVETVRQPDMFACFADSFLGGPSALCKHVIGVLVFILRYLPARNCAVFWRDSSA